MTEPELEGEGATVGEHEAGKIKAAEGLFDEFTFRGGESALDSAVTTPT
jgi:hypothetical protein